MTIDWNAPADITSIGQSMSLFRKRSESGAFDGLQGVVENYAETAPREHEQIEILRQAIHESRDSAITPGDPAIATTVVSAAKTALAKLNHGEAAANFTFAEQVGLESVIITDGTRPSLLIKNGFIALDAPDIGSWSFGLQRFKSKIKKVVAATGRIEVPVKPWFLGTGFVIAEGLVLTNRHVLEAIAALDASGTWVLKWPDHTYLNFCGEFDSEVTANFKVTSVAFAGSEAINRSVNFSRLDAAVLRVDVDSNRDAVFPDHVLLENDPAMPKRERDLYVVGFPGEPAVWSLGGAPLPGTETAQVLADLFGNKFGYKRLAPGILKAAPGEVTGDARKWIISHDASTLGGSSGSCVVDLGEDGCRILGLHFAGINRSQNWAHAAGAFKELSPLLPPAAIA